MAVLADRDIFELLDSGDLVIENMRDNPEEQIGSCSIDLRLGDTLINADNGSEIDLSVEEEGYAEAKFCPDVPYLATTMEKIDLPRNVCAEVKGRSSIGRKFIQVHEAGWVDAGFPGQITLEVINHRSHPQTFPVGQEFCQLVLYEMKSDPITSYPEKDSEKYSNQSGPTPSRLGEEQY